MDTRPDGRFRILPDAEIPKTQRARARFMPLTDQEYEILRPMTAAQRHRWLKENIPTKERLARQLGSVGAHALAYNARQGRYSDFDGESATPKLDLLRDLKRSGHHDVAKLVMAGEYDDNKTESDRWAHEQVGEIGRVLDKLGLR